MFRHPLGHRPFTFVAHAGRRPADKEHTDAHTGPDLPTASIARSPWTARDSRCVVTGDRRIPFGEYLAEIDALVTQIFALVTAGLAEATEALLAGDRAAGQAVVEKDLLIDELHHRVEQLTVYRVEELTLQAEHRPTPQDLRLLLLVLRIVPALERSGDLVKHIARRAGRSLAAELTPSIRGLLNDMGLVGVEEWKMAGEAYSKLDPGAVRRIKVRDAEMDEMHLDLTAELASGTLSYPAANQMTLVARFYERLGDHAVNVARRVEDADVPEPGRDPSS